jgi:glycosyltransferase involved in cell wall biosynthesis
MVNAMRVLYDHQTFTWQKYGGISRYFAELISICNSTGAAECEVSLVCSNNHYLSEYNIFRPSGLARRMGHIFSKRIQYSINKANSRIALSRGSYDIFHPTYYDPYFLRHVKNKPYVLTIHDMIHELYPELFEKNCKIAEYKKTLAYHATKIISVSENTKKDILRLYEIDVEKIEVIYHGSSINKDSMANLSQQTDTIIAGNLKLPDRFLLFVGNRNSYKNFYRLIDSIASILKNDASLFMVCTGSSDFSTSELAYFNSLAIRHKIIYIPVNDSILAHLYQKALAFVFPSLYEGFGLPILEAFSCGCPVALSDSGSFPEVAKDAAIYFDPYVKSSIEEAILKIIYDEKLRASIRCKGYEISKDFSWEKTAEKTLSLYRNIL